MKNKILCFMLAFLTLFNCIVPQLSYVYAADVDNNILVVDGYVFDVNTGTIETYYEGLGNGSVDIIVPAEIENVQVVAIADDAFADCDSLASITVVGNENSITGAPWGGTAEIIWVDELPSDEIVMEAAAPSTTGVMATTLSVDMTDADYGISTMSQHGIIVDVEVETDVDVEVEVETDVATFDITVPTSMPITVSADGTVDTSSDFGITNNTNGIIYVDSVEVDTLNSWSIVDFDTDFSKEKVNLKQFGLKINGDEVSTSGVITSGNVADWDMAGENETIDIAYNANIAVQGDYISEKIANVTFTLVSYIEPIIIDTTNSLIFESDTAFTLSVSSAGWDGDLYYTTGSADWAQWDGTSIASSDDGKLYLRGAGNTIIGGSSDTNAFTFTSATNLVCSGNIESLLDWETVADGGSPTMGERCYGYMFYGCSSLKTAPTLPATTLATYCYYNMFYGCTSLTTVPKLPATTFYTGCYAEMFYGCTSLKVSSSYTSALYKYSWRIPTTGTGSSPYTPYPCDGMLDGTGGTYTSDPSINTTYYVTNSPV